MTLELRNLTTSVPGEDDDDERRVLFTNLDFRVDDGDIRVINGPSGCGKSTLLRALACLDPVDRLNKGKAGDPVLTLNGHTPDTWGYPCWRTQVHYVHQKPPPFLGTPHEFYNEVRSFKAQRTAHSGKFPSAVRQATIDAQMKKRLEVDVAACEKIDEFYNEVRSFKAQRAAHSGKFPSAVRQATIDAQMKKRLEVDVAACEKNDEFYNEVRSFKAHRTAHSGKFPSAVHHAAVDAQMKKRLEVDVHEAGAQPAASGDDEQKAASSALLRPAKAPIDHAADSYWTDPIQIAESWAIPPSRFERAWSSLSGGECQRVFLAICVALRPLVLLVDEPTSALDHDTALLVEDTLVKSGLTLVWVTHDLEQIQRLGAPVFEFPGLSHRSSLVDES